MSTTKSIKVKLNYTDQHYRWQMFFNAFTVEKTSGGHIVRFAYIGPDGAACQIVPVFLSDDGLKQFRDSAGGYLAGLGLPDEPPLNTKIPETKVFSPHYANHLRAAYSREIGELAFYLIVHHIASDKANASKGNATEADINANPIALFHSAKKLHTELLLELLKT